MDCKSCKGEGQIWVSGWDGDDTQIQCCDCKGTGFVEGREGGEKDGPLTKWLIGLIVLGTLIYSVLN